jgi:hypothetical protein
LITQATKKKDALSLKQENNRQQIDQYISTQEVWLARQQGKLAEANNKKSHGFSFSITTGIHRQSPEWYEKKIAQGNAKYQQRLTTKQQLLQKIETELDTAETELALSSRIQARLDDILKPEGSLVLDTIVAEVNARRARLEEALDKGAVAENVDAEVFDFKDSEVV